jgi:hypothetical protein
MKMVEIIVKKIVKSSSKAKFKLFFQEKKQKHDLKKKIR